MDESLIGHEARLSLPCDPSVVPLLMGFIEELLLVGDGDVEAPERLEEQLQGAIAEICGRRGARGEEGTPSAGAVRGGDLEVTLSITETGVDVSVRSPRSGGEGTSITVREA